MKLTYYLLHGETQPKRGDLVQTNVGNARERTWFVLRSRQLLPRWSPEMGIVADRTKIWCERWWEIDPSTRQALHRSAERHGGQRVHLFRRFPAKCSPKARIYQ